MPTYEYVCKKCKKNTEAVQSFHDAPLTVCPHCGGELRKVFGAVGISFKGSGFYKTDSRPRPKESAASSGTDSKGTDSKGSESKGSESKGSESKSTDTKGSESKTGDSKTSDSKSSGAKDSKASGSSTKTPAAPKS